MNFFDELGDLVSYAYNEIKNAVWSFINMVKGVVKQIVTAIINFVTQVVQWFKNLPLVKGRDIPFLMKGNDFKSMLKNAPTKNIGLFEGVYNEEEDEISELRYLAADQVDTQTQQTMGNEPIVVFS